MSLIMSVVLPDVTYSQINESLWLFLYTLKINRKMNKKRIFQKLFPLLACIALGVNNLWAVPVTITQIGEGVCTVYEGTVPKAGKNILDLTHSGSKTFEATEGKYYVLFVFPDNSAGKWFELESLLRKDIEKGEEKTKYERPSEKGDGYITKPWGFKVGTEITKAEYVVTFTNQIKLTYTPPTAEKATLHLEYEDHDATKHTVDAPGNIPRSAKKLMIRITPVSGYRPVIKYTNAVSAIQSNPEVTLTLQKTDETYTGDINLKDLISLTLEISLEADECLVTFVPPSSELATLKLTYKLGSGEEKELKTTGNVPRNTQLNMSVTLKASNKTLHVASKKDGQQNTSITMTPKANNEFTGSVLIDVPLTLYFRLEDKAPEEEVPAAVIDNPHSEVRLYHNAAEDVLRVFGLQQSVHYELFNLQGLLVGRGTIPEGANSLSTYNLSAVFYFLVLESETERRVLSFVK